MRLLVLLISISVCHAKLNKAMQKTIDGELYLNFFAYLIFD